MRYFPGPLIFHEDQGGTFLFPDGAGFAFEIVIQNKGRDPNIAEDIDLQVIRAHREATDQSQAGVLALTSSRRVLPAELSGGKLGECGAVEVITIQARHIFLLGGIKDFVQAMLDVRPLPRIINAQICLGQGRASGHHHRTKQSRDAWQNTSWTCHFHTLARGVVIGELLKRSDESGALAAKVSVNVGRRVKTVEMRDNVAAKASEYVGHG